MHFASVSQNPTKILGLQVSFTGGRDWGWGG